MAHPVAQSLGWRSVWPIEIFVTAKVRTIEYTINDIDKEQRQLVSNSNHRICSFVILLIQSNRWVHLCQILGEGVVTWLMNTGNALINWILSNRLTLEMQVYPRS